MKDAAKLDEIEKRLMLKGDANALRRAQRAKENSNLFLYLINSTKMQWKKDWPVFLSRDLY